MYRAVIFDVDGTLVDSNDAHAAAWVRALAEFGRTVEFSRVRPLIGKGGDKVLPELTGISAESPEGKAISARRSEIFLAEFAPALQPTRGARQLLEWLRDDRLKLYVATSAKDDELQPLLRVAGAEKMFEAKASSDDAAESKPDPDIVLAALDQTGCPADAVVMIGDTPYDVEAARRARVRIVAFECGGWHAFELDADAVYADAADLLRRYDDSLLARERASGTR